MKKKIMIIHNNKNKKKSTTYKNNKKKKQKTSNYYKSIGLKTTTNYFRHGDQEILDILSHPRQINILDYNLMT